MSKKCSFVKENGTSCNAFVVNGSDFCFFHDPERSEDKKEAVIKGGLQIKRPRVDDEIITITKAGDVKLLLARTINEVRQGKLSAREANCIGFLANHLLTAIDKTDIQTKIEEVENAIKFRKENR